MRVDQCVVGNLTGPLDFGGEVQGASMDLPAGSSTVRGEETGAENDHRYKDKRRQQLF